MNKYIKEAIDKVNALDSDDNDSIHYGIIEEVIVKESVLKILNELDEKLELKEVITKLVLETLNEVNENLELYKNKFKPADLYRAAELHEGSCGDYWGYKSCYLCSCFESGCAAGHGDDDFGLASKDKLIKRYLDTSGKFSPKQKIRILEVLKKYYDFQLDKE